jgi:hypothetical protein
MFILESLLRTSTKKPTSMSLQAYTNPARWLALAREKVQRRGVISSVD